MNIIMKNLSIIFLAATIFSAVSCNKEDDADTIFIETEAALPENSSVSWTDGADFSLYSDVPGDQIKRGRGFFCLDSSTSLFGGKISNDESRTAVYAIYPRQSIPYMQNIDVSVPDVQTYGDGSDYEILTAFAPADGNDISNLSFRMLCVKWNIRFKNREDTPQTVTGITLKSESENIPVLGVLESIETGNFTGYGFSDSMTSLLEYGISTDGELSFILLPGDLGEKQFTIRVNCEDGTSYSADVKTDTGFGKSGTVMETMIDLNEINADDPGSGGVTEGIYTQITSLDELVDGEYYIAGAMPNASSSKYDLMTDELSGFSYTEDHDDANSTGKKGTGLTGGYGAVSGKWNPGESAVWEFRHEGSFDMKAGNTVKVDGWSIKDSKHDKYLNLDNGQNIGLADYIENTAANSNLLKQRWTLSINSDGTFSIRSIQNSGRYLHYYPDAGSFILTGLNSSSVSNVLIYKKE